ncbi:calcium-binding protein [Oceanicola sp. 22II-s10i]|uniref:calcium-binding protein n=1 Tax=Oceanicola sp. 22II-s10i TaxID=1317116 RepID=UPI001132422F|nr:calcium-binding protein [Oceanicola sp. 22II-s10i]
MQKLQFKETLTTGFGTGSAHVSILPTGTDRARVVDHLAGTATDVRLGASLVRTGTGTLDAGERLAFGGMAGEVPLALLGALQGAAAGSAGGSATAYLNGTVSHILSAPMTAARIGGQDMLFATARVAQQISAFALDTNGGVTALAGTGTSGEAYGAALSALGTVSSGGADFLYTASGMSDGLTGYRIGANGGLTRVESYGVDESLPVHALTALEGITAGGTGWLIAAAAGSSSLTVMRVAGGGKLTVTDHVLDDLGTRFAGVSALEVVAAGGRVFVLAAGTDDGLSLFTLMPNGRLLHVDSVADAAGVALDNPSGLSAQVVGGTLEILVTAAGEGGLSRFSLDLTQMTAPRTQATGLLEGGGGDDLLTLTGAGELRGGAGDDILVDGAGSGRMSGGAGEDTFVLRADGARDVILDFEIGQDRLDLSAWTRFYDRSEQSVQTGSGGSLILRHGTEELELRPAQGRLRASDADRLDIVALSRVDVLRAPREVSDPEPVPEPPAPAPAPAPVPAPTPAPSPAPAPAPAPTPAPAPEPSPAPEPAPSPSPTPAPEPGRLVKGGTGPDALTGGGGADFIDAGGGDDTIFGGAGDDSILGRDGNDVIRGGAGRDNIAASDGDDQVYGEDGHDLLGGGHGHDTVEGGAGNDVIGTGSGHDLLIAGDGDDTVSGGWGHDTVKGGDGDDEMAGSYDADTVKGGAGDDMIGGGTGNDVIEGGIGNDMIGAGDDDDRVLGEAGNDFLGGGAGADTMLGGEGDDRLNGGSGDDRMAGGTGGDEFIFTAFAAGERDVIFDFTPGEDVIRMHGIQGAGMAGRFDALAPHAEGGSTVLGWKGHVIVLEGIAPDELGPGDFLFL